MYIRSVRIQYLSFEILISARAGSASAIKWWWGGGGVSQMFGGLRKKPVFRMRIADKLREYRANIGK